MRRDNHVLDSTINALLNVGDRCEVEEILRQTPLLLSAEGLARIQQRAKEAHASGLVPLAEMLDNLAHIVTAVQAEANRFPFTVTALVEELLGVNSWEEAHRLIQEHPELLSDEADAYLKHRIDMTRAQGGDTHFILENQALLRRCREIGVEAAFAEKARLFETVYDFVQAETWAEARDILQEHPELLSDEVDHILEHMAEDARASGEEGAATFLQENRELLRQSREVGIEAAFAEVTAGGTSSQLMAALDEFLAASTLKETKEVLVRHPELLTDEADQLLMRVIDAAREQNDTEGAEYFTGRRHLLQVARREGLDNALANM